MMLTTFDPFNGLERFDRAVGGLLNAGRSWSPATNIVEDAQGYALRFDLPGMTKEDIDINVEKGVLEVSGERQIVNVDDENVKNHRLESFVGRFSRSFRLPDHVDPSSVTATYKHGVLEVRLARSQAAQPRKVAIVEN
jgi:HSP20 family protein